MALIVDAGPLVAQANRNDPDQAAVAAVLRAERGPLVVPAFVAAEADHLILTRLGVDAELAFLRDLRDTYAIESLTPAELEAAAGLIDRYRGLRIGLADASLVVLAARHRTTRLATFDERHLRAVEPLQGGHFTLLPADAARG